MFRYYGFSLIEILIIATIIGILAAVISPSFTRIMKKNNRSDATTMLLKVQYQQEKWRATHNQYANREELKLAEIINDNYLLKITTLPEEDNYLASAIPLNSQSNDLCGSFALNQFGPIYQGFASADCWQQ